ncbi:calcium/sodium antiporter [Carboxylicivirga mesophila]|uniref:Calcium/sodium antiporter n=1 Tax=Carboxylicivirga mesophila TaxID=1166478 RepID=A0ABS5KG67_9BACT|nr:calcium/sodium antiporter [Carboxylicivirga mesophila]MBS2213526.1 calcium/sodium antiporter [Carboxylicivirga mesophila]
MPPVLYLLAGFVLLFFSGDWLVKSSVQLARHFKVSTLVIGITVVAFGTSAPELLVSLRAVFDGAADISVGNVVGSNIANIALVLGMVAIVYPVKVIKKTVWLDWIVMMLATLGLILASSNFIISSFEGILFIVLLGVYIIWAVFNSRKQGKSKEKIEKPSLSLVKTVLLFLLAAAGLYYGAEWLVVGAKDIATRLGVSERVIGISVVAVGTSIPELATSLIAAIKKESDISIGNIIGSNIFNIWAVLGVTSTIKPINVSPSIVNTDYWWMVGIAILLFLSILPLSKGLVSRWKGGIFLSIYILYIYLLFV